MKGGRALLLGAAAALAACGPSRTQIRKAVLASPYRSITVLPFDYRAGERNLTGPLSGAVAARLRADGFRLADARKTQGAYNAWLAKRGAFDDAAACAHVAAALGSSAVLTGVQDDAYERVVRRPAVIGFEPVAPPWCCGAPKPCRHWPVYDPAVSQYVDACGGWHRRVVESPADTDRYGRLDLRVRLLDAKTSAVLWQTRYSGELHHSSLAQVLQQAADALDNQLTDAVVNGRL